MNIITPDDGIKEDAIVPISQRDGKIEKIADLRARETQSETVRCGSVYAAPRAWRNQACSWFYSFVDHYHIDRQAAFTAIQYLDHVASFYSGETEENITNDKYRLHAALCLYWAIKLNLDKYLRNPKCTLNVDDLLGILQPSFPNTMIESSSVGFLQEFRTIKEQPSSASFLAAYFRLCPSWQGDCFKIRQALYELSKYLVEMSIYQSTMSAKPSVIAYAAILFSIKVLHDRMQLPRVVQAKFLREIENATTLSPDCEDVLTAMNDFETLYPNILADDQVDGFVADFMAKYLNVGTVSSCGCGRVSPWEETLT